jgi:hypothetical protein
MVYTLLVDWMEQQAKEKAGEPAWKATPPPLAQPSEEDLTDRFPVALEKFWAVSQSGYFYATGLSHLFILLTS